MHVTTRNLICRVAAACLIAAAVYALITMEDLAEAIILTLLAVVLSRVLVLNIAEHRP